MFTLKDIESWDAVNDEIKSLAVELIKLQYSDVHNIDEIDEDDIYSIELTLEQKFEVNFKLETYTCGCNDTDYYDITFDAEYLTDEKEYSELCGKMIEEQEQRKQRQREAEAERRRIREYEDKKRRKEKYLKLKEEFGDV